MCHVLRWGRLEKKRILFRIFRFEMHIEVIDEIVILLQTMLSSYLKMSSKHSDVRIWTSGKASELEV